MMITSLSSQPIQSYRVSKGTFFTGCVSSWCSMLHLIQNWCEISPFVWKVVNRKCNILFSVFSKFDNGKCIYNYYLLLETLGKNPLNMLGPTFITIKWTQNSSPILIQCLSLLRLPKQKQHRQVGLNNKNLFSHRSVGQEDSE